MEDDHRHEHSGRRAHRRRSWSSRARQTRSSHPTSRRNSRTASAPSATSWDRELRGRRDLRLDATQAIDHVGDAKTSDRVEKVTPHSPRERLLPADLNGHRSR